MLYVTMSIQILAMVLGPLALGLWLRRRGFGTWKIFLAGALAFVASQVVHIPFLIGLTALLKHVPALHIPHAWRLPVNSVILGLAAGLCEEPARWITLRRFLKSARGFRVGVMLGAGHGGIESMFVGALAALSFIGMILLRAVGPTRLGVHEGQLELVNAQMTKFWATPPWMGLVAIGERVMAVTMHLALSSLVMRGVMTKHARWLLASIALHALLDGLAVYAMDRGGVLVTELIMVGFTAAAIAILFAMRRRDASTGRPGAGALPDQDEGLVVQREQPTVVAP